MFFPDSRTLASATSGWTEPPTHQIFLWDVRTGRRRRAVRWRQQEDEYINTVALSPNGQQIECASSDGSVTIINARSGRIEKTARGLVARAPAAVFSPNGKTLATGTGGQNHWTGEVRLWEVRTGKLLRVFRCPHLWVRSLACSPDGRTLACGGGDGVVHLWDVRTGALEHTLSGRLDFVKALAFSPDGKTLISGGIGPAFNLKSVPSGAGGVELWDVRSGQLRATLAGQLSKKGDWIAFTPRGYYAGSPGVERLIQWRVNGKLLAATAYAGEFHRPTEVRRALMPN